MATVIPQRHQIPLPSFFVSSSVRTKNFLRREATPHSLAPFTTRNRNQPVSAAPTSIESDGRAPSPVRLRSPTQLLFRGCVSPDHVFPSFASLFMLFVRAIHQGHVRSQTICFVGARVSFSLSKPISHPVKKKSPTLLFWNSDTTVIFKRTGSSSSA